LGIFEQGPQKQDMSGRGQIVPIVLSEGNAKDVEYVAELPLSTT